MTDENKKTDETAVKDSMSALICSVWVVQAYVDECPAILGVYSDERMAIEHKERVIKEVQGFDSRVFGESFPPSMAVCIQEHPLLSPNVELTRGADRNQSKGKQS